MGKKLEKELSSIADLEAGLNVVAYRNTLAKDGSLYVRVKSRVASVKAILNQIKEDNTSADLSEIKRSLELYNNAALKLLKNGFSVKIMDLGILKIAHHGSIKSKEEAKNITNFIAEFEPDQSVENAVKGLEVDAVIEFDASPRINEIIDLKRQVSDGKITRDRPMAITGTKLKLDTALDEIYFVPQDEEGEDVSEKEKWIKLDMADLFRNKPTELNLTVPSGLESGTKYRLVIRRVYTTNNDKPTVITSESDVFEAI